MASKEVNREIECEQNERIIVFQCVECNAIAGDTTNWVCSDRELNTVSLSVISDSVKVGNDLKFSKVERDSGSVFKELKCKLCSHVLGRIYVSTSKEMDIMRDMFTLDLAQLLSYEVGTGASVDCDLAMSMIESVECLQADMKKVMHVIVEQNVRLGNIENQLKEELNGSDAENTLNETEKLDKTQVYEKLNASDTEDDAGGKVNHITNFDSTELVNGNSKFALQGKQAKVKHSDTYITESDNEVINKKSPQRKKRKRSKQQIY